MELFVKRTSDTSPVFVKVRDLPSPLREVVQGYKHGLNKGCADNKSLGYPCWQGCLHDPEGAAGECLEASGHFREILMKCGISGRTHRLREYMFYPLNATERRRKERDKLIGTFPFDTSGCRFHYVVKLGDLIIDWTARQFGAANPFPAIWRERDPSTRKRHRRNPSSTRSDPKIPSRTSGAQPRTLGTLDNSKVTRLRGSPKRR